MDYKRIFLKEATPTSIGGQAIMEGVMMRGEDRTAIAVRVPGGRVYLKTEKNKPKSAVTKVPFVRGVYSFFVSLISGMKTLTDSADILEYFTPDEDGADGEGGKSSQNSATDQKTWGLMMVLSVIIALAISIAVFVIFPTVAVSWLGKYITNSVALNLIEGLFRILLFVLYVVLIRRMEDIKTLFRYHGAEHKTIHCFENGLELTPENAREFYTLHPRCGTSFLVFVFIISLLLFSLLGWPNVWMRILSRLLLLPVIAGISYELLKWAGRSDNALIRVLSYPGLQMQRLTTAEPTDDQLQVAIISLKAVLVPADTPEVEGFVDNDANIIEPFSLADARKAIADEAVMNGDASAAGGRDKVSRDTEEIELPKEDADEAATDDAAADEAVSGSSSADKPAARGFRYSEDTAMVRNAVRTAQKMLKDIPNGDREAIDIFCYVMGWTKSEIVTKDRELLDQDDLDAYMDRIRLRLSGTPLQYIVKVQEFMGLPFKVNPSVLIPRLDTEVLAEQVIGIIRGKGWSDPRVLDLCTGSGILGVTIAHEFPESRVTLTDVSQEAIATAEENARINGTEANCTFITGNMFQVLSDDDIFDVIVSNPPYIRSDVIETLDTEVKDHEPRLALDGGEDGLDAYRTIALESWQHLRSGGVLALEIGHDQADAVSLLLEISKQFGKPVVIKDLNGLDRVIIVERK